MKRALLAGGIAFSFGGGVVACGELVGLDPPPGFVRVDGAASDAPIASDATADTSEVIATNDAGDAADAPPPVADADNPPCVFDLDGAIFKSSASWNQAGAQTIPAGVTPNLTTMLIQRSPTTDQCSSGLLLLISDDPDASGVFSTQVVTPPAAMDTSYEENVTILDDGLTLIGLNQTDTTFLVSRRSAVGAADFPAAESGPFGQIQAAAGTPQTLWAPVISVDELEFFYVVRNDPDASVNGIYQSVRGSMLGSFPPGTRMPDLIQDGGLYVTGITADRRTLFVEVSTAARNVVFTRQSTADPFVNPNAPASPPAGVSRAKPFRTCNDIVATCSGSPKCSDEAICATPR